MALDFQALQTEFYARGFDYFNDGGAGVTRAKRWLNDANHFINSLEQWEFLQKTGSGAAPLTINDLGQVELVTIASNISPLTFVDRRALADMYGDLAGTGTPVFYYVTGGTTVNVFPVSTASITVRYYKTDPDMTANGDTPSMPDRFRYAIVDYAVASALEDKSNYNEAAAARQSGDRVVQLMRDTNVLLPGAGGQQAIVGASTDW